MQKDKPEQYISNHPDASGAARRMVAELNNKHNSPTIGAMAAAIIALLMLGYIGAYFALREVALINFAPAPVTILTFRYEAKACEIIFYPAMMFELWLRS